MKNNLSNQYLLTLSLAMGVVLALFLWQGHLGFNLWDEGFLWYGAQRVMLGEVPIRDFMAYDPGRYYWSASVMRLFGDNGIMALRMAVALSQILGLWIGLLLLRCRVKCSLPFLLLAIPTVALWMFPRHKLFDISLSLILISTLTFLIQKPSDRRFFLSGFFLGLIAFFGRNHGMYGLIGSLSAILYLRLQQGQNVSLLHSGAIWATGVVIGYLPMLLMIALIPGFSASFWDSLYFLFEAKSTNLPLPVPWPWQAIWRDLPSFEAVREILLGSYFLATLLFGVFGWGWVIWQRRQKKIVSEVLVASIVLALPYAHFAFSRADIGHLAQGIFPLLLGVLSLLSQQPAKIKWPLTALLGGTTLLLMLPVHPGWRRYASQQWVGTHIANQTLTVDPGTAGDIALLTQLAETYAPNNGSFVVTPFWPGAYALLGRPSPMWEIYALFPRSPLFEKKEIERIKAAKPGFVFVIDLPLDGRDALRFRNTHPLIHQYILEQFDPLPNHSNPAYHLYRSKRPIQ